MEGLLGNFIEKFWLKPISILFLIFINGIFIYGVFPKELSPNYTFFIILCILLFAIDYWYFFNVIKHNKIPKAKKDDLAVLFIIKAESKKQFIDTQSKFINCFNYMIKEDSRIQFKVFYIQFHNIERLDLSSIEKEKELLVKTSCRYLIKIEVKADDIDNENKYELTINSGVIHRTYIKDINEKFMNDFNNISKYSKRLEYEKKDKIYILRFTANQMAYVCRYICGVTFYLDGNFELAEIICDDLYEVLNRNKTNEPVRNTLVNILPFRCFEIHFQLAQREYQKYTEHENMIYVENMYHHLIRANTFYPNTYGYYLMLAIYHFLHNRSIIKAKACIDKCKEIIPNGEWRFSQAFISAYEGRSPLIVYRQYKKAFEIDYNLVDLTIFVERIIEIEPKRILLHFALFLLYEKTGDKVLMQENLELFINKSGKDNLDMQLIKLLKEKYSIDLEDTLSNLEVG